MQKGLFNFMLAGILLLAACDSNSGVPEEIMPLETWFPLHVGDKEILAQLAVRTHEQRKGLMYRENLEDDSGMLFTYKTPQQVSFYMKNTPLPLDIGFFDGDGVLREIHRMMPYDTTSTISNSAQIQFALEMNQGWYSRNNIYPGSQMDLSMLTQALLKRGEDPQTYGLDRK